MSIQPQPDTCDYPGCYVPATTWTAAGTKYCDRHKPAVKRVYVPGTAWDWNSAPGFDKNKNRKKR